LVGWLASRNLPFPSVPAILLLAAAEDAVGTTAATFISTVTFFPQQLLPSNFISDLLL
jgi:hypothetical protein